VGDVKKQYAWGWPLLSRKAHVFYDARSLCGKWLFTGSKPEDVIEKAPVDRGPDDCAACHKKLVAHFKPEKVAS
jgi:hypothetical protein